MNPGLVFLEPESTIALRVHVAILLAHPQTQKSPDPTTRAGSEIGGSSCLFVVLGQHRSAHRPTPLVKAARPGVAQVASTEQPPQALRHRAK